MRVGGVTTSLILTCDLHAWVYATCGRLQCSPAALVRAAITYDATDAIRIGVAYRWRDRGIPARRRLTLRMTVRQHAHLAAAACARPGYGATSAALRRMIWRLRAAIDGPVHAGDTARE